MGGRAVVSDDEEELDLQDDEREQDEEGEELDDGEGGGGGGDDDDEDEDDEEGQDEFENDGFIVDGDEEEEEPEEEEEDRDDDEERHRKKRKKKRESFELDDDDYELLLDNNVKVPRKETKKLKRLKKARRDADVGHSGLSDEDEFDGAGRGGRTAEEQVKRSLFGDDDGGPVEDIPEDDEQVEEEDPDLNDEDDMADFIVDEDEVDDDGMPIRRKPQKKKKHRQAPGVPSSALQEAHDIFGDVEELLDMRRRLNLERDGYDDSGQWKDRGLEHEFEPIILAERYMTDKDDRMREIDVPERLQIFEESTGPPPTDNEFIEAETKWIKKQLESGQIPGLANVTFGEEVEDHIRNFLNFTHVQKLDLPYIAMYRKEDIYSLLKDPETGEDVSHDKPALRRHKVLWVVYDSDRKWLLLQKRKSALHGYYNKRFEEESRRVYDETRLGLNRQLFETIIEALRLAESEREVDDVDSKFNLHFPPGEAGVDEGQYRRPKRKSLYSICNKAGLWEVGSKFGYNSEQFGRLITLEIKLDEPEDPKETPEDVASNFTCAMFDSPQAVLKGARHMASVEISCEPRVKKHFRSIYFDNAVVSTCPTSDGNVVIDAFHQFSGVKWLRNKPLNKFEDAQWLLIQKAEEEKLLQVTIKMPEENLKKLLTESEDQYLNCGVSKLAQLWNEQRKLILQDAIFNFILPTLEKEARMWLTSRAKTWLLMDYGEHLWNKVSVAPYQRKESDMNSEDEAAPRVMACCWGPGKPPTTFVMLDSFGEVIDVLEAGSISLRSQNVSDQHRKKHDQMNLLKFMTEHQPQVVVLGAVSLSCTRLKDDIYEIVFKMVEENPRDVGHEMDGLSVFYGDESLPRLYENSRISSDQNPGHKGVVRRAVALGRYLQNPLAMVANLCGPGREILSWKLSPLESFLNADEKYAMVEQIMVDVTNQVGIDLNLAANHDWLFAPLQFVSGLGPRKAASLQRSLARAGAIVTRKDLLTAHGLGRKVFISAAGFLRVRRSGLAVSTSQFVDVLDDTRIHPESYALAQEMAKDIYTEIVGDDNFDDDDIEMAIEHLRDRPSALKSFSVDAYAKDTDRLSKIETLHAIKMELIQGFQDWRKAYEEPNQDEEFYMISGETDATLSEGRVVQATVRKVQPQRAMCALESGLTGMLAREDFSDDWRDCDLTEKLHEGDILTCKIKSIQKNRYQVFLTCKENDMRNIGHPNIENRDPYYQEDSVSLPSEQDKARKNKELAKKRFKPRMIVHPRFQNITADEAMELLADKEPGESVIRPSSRGPSYLTLTLKIYDGVFAHKDIIEGGKDHKDITSLLRIGKTLQLGEDTFEDLDEVMDRYVDPLVTHLKAMLNYRKFRKGTKAEVDELLRIEKLDNPARIVYSFGISHEHPGTFILTYIRSSNPHHEYIGLYPKGFKFRKRMFDNIDRLVAYFQRHIDDPIHESPSIRSVAAMVPMRSPATGGSSGGGGWGGSGGNDAGWRGSSDRDHLRAGRNDYRNGGRDGHPSGAPRPYEGGGRGRGRGRGRGGRGSYDGTRDGGSRDGGDSSYGWKRGSDNRDSGHGSKRGSDNNKEGSNSDYRSFPGAKVHNAPGEEAFPGGWSSSGAGGSSSVGGESSIGGLVESGGDARKDSRRGSGSVSGSKSYSDSRGGGGGW
ncbi:unnamed protein product [Amaranthus hypochondriacus]